VQEEPESADGVIEVLAEEHDSASEIEDDAGPEPTADRDAQAYLLVESSEGEETAG
jgi:hypothetical protein